MVGHFVCPYGRSISDKFALGYALGAQRKRVHEIAGLVPDSLMNKTVEARLDEPDTSGNYTLEGFSQMLDQTVRLVARIALLRVRSPVFAIRVELNRSPTRAGIAHIARQPSIYKGRVWL